MYNKQIFKLGIGFFFFCQSIFAETVLLRNGNILRGKLKSQSINDIGIVIDDKEQKISKNLVFRVLYRDMSQTEAKKALLAEIKKLSPKEREKLLSEINDKSIVSEAETKSTNEKPAKEEVIVTTEKPTSEANTEPNKEKEKIQFISKWGYVWRSALIPGWGHIKAEYYKTGFFYGTIFYGSIISTAYFTDQLKQAIKERDEKINTNNLLTLGAGGPSSALLLFAGGSSSTTSDDQKILAYRSLLYGSAGAALGVYIIQLINVYVIGVRIEKSRVSGINFYSVPEFSSLTKEVGTHNGISYTISF